LIAGTCHHIRGQALLEEKMRIQGYAFLETVKPQLVVTCALMVIGVFFKAVAADSEPNPSAVVERFQAVLLSVMREGSKLGYAGRYKRLAPAVQESHDLQSITEFAAGRYWNQLDAQQKTTLVGTFSEFSIASYAHNFDSFSGENFKIISTEQNPRGDAVVRSDFTKPGEETIRFDYVLRRRDGRWRIVNVIVDGVSDLAARRAEFASIMGREGFAALIRKLNEKIALYSKRADYRNSDNS
jgi:phospholipid transport system substrate-binding protein